MEDKEKLIAEVLGTEEERLAMMAEIEEEWENEY